MRPLEILLMFANLLAFSVLAVPRLRVIRWTGYMAVMALLIAGVQALFEGPRWQMVPAYSLAGLFFLVYLLMKIAPAGEPAGRRRIKRLAAGLAAGLGVLALAASIVLPAIIPVFRFPHTSGPYAIGTLTYHWVDAGRPEVFTADPNDRRELMVQIFMHGFTGFRQMNTFQVEELVSHGYIVAAIDQPYAAAAVVFPDGRQAIGLTRDQMDVYIRQSLSPAEKAPSLNGRTLKDGIIPYLAQDVTFTLDQLAALNQTDPNDILTGRLDLQHAGIFGISLGGIVDSEACHLEPRLRACLVMDAPMPADVVRDGLQQPTMWITRDAATMQLEGWSQADIQQHQTTMHAVYESLPGDGYFVRVRGMFHLNLTDLPNLSPFTRALGMTGPIDAQRAHSIINAYTLAFFDSQLKGQPASALDDLVEQYPEVLFETRHP